MAQSGMRSYTGDGFRVPNRRTRRQLLQIQERVGENTRQVDKFGRPHRPVGRGGKAVQPTQLHIAGYDGDDVTRKQRFLCHYIDENGNPITSNDDGPVDPFVVWAYSKPHINGNYGEQKLDECDPHYVIGDRLFAIQRTAYMGEVAGLVSDWFAVDTFTVFGAPVVEP